VCIDIAFGFGFASLNSLQQVEQQLQQSQNQTAQLQDQIRQLEERARLVHT
jgi:cell division protein FtsB